MPENNWRDRALCAQTDPDAFLPEVGGSTKEAKKICASCDVREQCLRWALEHEEKGIWGGTSDQERKKIRGTKEPSRDHIPFAVAEYRAGESVTVLATKYNVSKQTIYNWASAANGSAA